jgi:hypothetical protein
LIEEFLSVLGFKDLKKDYNGYTIKIDLKKKAKFIIETITKQHKRELKTEKSK